MKAALLPGRGVVKVAGDDARSFLHGLVSADILKLAPGAARFCALLTPQGKIIADFFVVEAPVQDGGGFFLDLPRSLTTTVVGKLNLYKLRARVMVEDLSEVLGVLAAWEWTRNGQHRPLVSGSAPAGARASSHAAAATRRRRSLRGWGCHG